MLIICPRRLRVFEKRAVYRETAIIGSFSAALKAGTVCAKGRMTKQQIPAKTITTSKYQRVFGIRLRALVLALFAYVGSGIGASAVRTLEVFAGSEGESLPVLEATEVRRKTIHETHLHHRRFSERQRRKDSYRPKPLSLRLITQPETFTLSLDASPPSLRAPPFST